jgi:pimeloyl-ACP methyl ester carboxylesterase
MLLLSLALLAAPALPPDWVDSVAVRDIKVAEGETLRTTSLGSGKPVVLIPGLFGGAYSYRKITEPLVAQGYRAVVVEPLGYGWSSHPKKADYSLDAQAQRVDRASGFVSPCSGPTWFAVFSPSMAGPPKALPRRS